MPNTMHGPRYGEAQLTGQNLYPRNHGKDLPDQAKDAAAQFDKIATLSKRKPLSFAKLETEFMLKVSPWKEIVRELPLRLVPEPRDMHHYLFTSSAYTLYDLHCLSISRVTMSSATSDVTYTSVYQPTLTRRALWGADDEEISEGGIPRVIVLGYDGLPLQPPEPKFIQAHDPDYVPEPIYPEYIPLEDDHEFPAEEQPLPPIDSPTTESPGYVTESDPEEDPEEYEDDETEDGPVDYPMDGGDDGDDETEIHLGMNARDEMRTRRMRITIRPQTSVSLPPEAEVERLLAMTTPSPSPPISLSPPSAGERLARCTAPPAHSPPLPPSSGCLTQIQTLRIASTQALIDAVTAALPPPPLPPLPPSLYTLPPVDRMDDFLDLSSLPARGLVALLEDAHTKASHSTASRHELAGGRFRDRMTLQETVWMVEEEAYASREAWAHSIGLSQATHQELQTHRDHVYAHETYLQAHPTQLQLQRYSHIRTQHQWCALKNQVKFATCTLLGVALTWWNGQIRTLGPEAYAMTWDVLKKKMTDKYCPQGEIKKLEIELWNLKVKGNDVPAYTERFQELTLICTICAHETEKVDKYLSGLPDNIYGNVKAAKPKTLDETIELANDLMDRKLLTYAERQSDNKRNG
ncbi:putative reverse transcriptase domain-containing protein [Tanacetum coccineum]